MGEVSARRLRLRGQYTEARCSRCESCRGQRARAEYTFVRSRAEARERVCLRELWVSSPGARAPDASTVEPSRAELCECAADGVSEHADVLTHDGHPDGGSDEARR